MGNTPFYSGVSFGHTLPMLCVLLCISILSAGFNSMYVTSGDRPYFVVLHFALLDSL